MGGSAEPFAYPPIADYSLWIADAKPRREMTPEELAERHRKDRETYRRMRERMAIDPEYREARLAVSRETTRRFRERHPETEEQKERRRESDRDRYARLADELGERRRALYTGERAETIRARNREWYAANREKRRAYQKAYRAAHRDAINEREREKQRLEYANDPRKFNEYQKAWRARNPEKSHLYVRISRQQRRAAATGTHFTTAQWLALVEQYQGRCAYCGAKEKLEVEHKIPLSRGGTNDISNIVPACRRCNRRKRAKTDVEFRALLAREAEIREASSESEPDLGGSAPAG